jgi:hypothetical protein
MHRHPLCDRNPLILYMVSLNRALHTHKMPLDVPWLSFGTFIETLSVIESPSTLYMDVSLSPKYQQNVTIHVLESTYNNLLEHPLKPLIWQKVPLQKIMYYLTIQFATTCNYSSFTTMFYNHLFNFFINFVTMLQILNCTTFHID